jgi:hypothetical protein
MLAYIASILPGVRPGELAAMSDRKVEGAAHRRAIAEYATPVPGCDPERGPHYSPYCFLEAHTLLGYIWTHVDARGNVTGPSLDWHKLFRFDGMELFLLYYASASRQFRFSATCILQYRVSPYAASVAAGHIRDSHCYLCHDRHPSGRGECYMGNCPFGFHICTWCLPGLENDYGECDLCFPCEDDDCLGSNYNHCVNACEVLCTLREAGHPLSLGVAAHPILPPYHQAKPR